jgi:hypothetical protein
MDTSTPSISSRSFGAVTSASVSFSLFNGVDVIENPMLERNIGLWLRQPVPGQLPQSVGPDPSSAKEALAQRKYDVGINAGLGRLRCSKWSALGTGFPRVRLIGNVARGEWLIWIAGWNLEAKTSQLQDFATLAASSLTPGRPMWRPRAQVPFISPDRRLTARVLPKEIGPSVAVEVARFDQLPTRPGMGPTFSVAVLGWGSLSRMR